MGLPSGLTKRSDTIPSDSHPRPSRYFPQCLYVYLDLLTEIIYLDLSSQTFCFEYCLVLCAQFWNTTPARLPHSHSKILQLITIHYYSIYYSTAHRSSTATDRKVEKSRKHKISTKVTKCHYPIQSIPP